jgi:UDP-3-O-[3-hydroxymyristoyl] glucosamine N-acyltransferase
MALTLRAIADLVGGVLCGNDDIEILGVDSVETAKTGDLAALHSERLLEKARQCQASALVVNAKLADQIQHPHIIVDLPQTALNQVIDRLGLLPDRDEPGIHKSAWVHPLATVGADCCIGAFAVIGNGATVGSETRVRPHAVVEPGAVIGDRCLIHSHALVCSQSRIGNQVVVGGCAVIGAEGFGFDFGPERSIRLRHIGTVEIGDRAEIGANTTIDRARFGVTRIEADVKIDSQVHIGHNTSLGSHTHLSAQVGVAGSSHVGRQCILGGQVGVSDHVTITDKVTIGAKSGVANDIEEAGKYFGFWAKDAASGLREVASLAKLPAALRELKAIREQVAALREHLGIEEQKKGHSA